MWRISSSWISILIMVSFAVSEEEFRPCSEISRELRFPCRCSLGPIEVALEGHPAISVDCDRVVFAGDFPTIPYGAPIVSFRQRWTGHQALPTQLFASSGLPLRSVDFSGNSLRRLTEKLLQGLQTTLVELRLADNLLGDTLNPIFSTSELHGLKHLQIIDISGNGIKAIEEGIFEGCVSLQELYLDRNSLSLIPGGSLNGPKSLKVFSMRNNRMTGMKSGTFQSQLNLESIDVSENSIANIEGGIFNGLLKLKHLKLARNRLTKFNSDIFQGADGLQLMDLSENFISEFPTVALKAVPELRYLNLSSNMIQNLDNNDLLSLSNLYHLDLSRNNIANIVPGTFLGLKQLRKLDISVNSLRTIEDDAFEGLDNLEVLNLKDNNVLLIPASALGRLPRLASLQLDYNRITALSGDILRSIAERVTTLVLSTNVVRELPPATFQYFQQLQHLDLTRNLLVNLNSDTFSGLESTLLSLKIAQNKIISLGGPPLNMNELRRLDISDNQLSEIAVDAFSLLPNLEHLNLSRNSHLTILPPTVFYHIDKLKILDLSMTNLKILTPKSFEKLTSLQEIYLNSNDLTEITEGTFVNILNLTTIDLSNNKINNIRNGAFVNVMNLKKIFLKGNQLQSFKGEFFNTGTGLEIIDLSNNQISYLYTSSFRIHPRLKELRASANKLTFFPAELITELQFLEYIDLSNNGLKAVEELDFARLPRLRLLLLSGNQIDSINEMAFHNSTQLQVLDLSYNRLDRIGERTFEGLIRLERLNLEGNLLADLPELIFERARLQMLENINLARNLFQVAPLRSLQKQFFFVSSVDLSHNQIREIPADDSIMVNIKDLDLSFNPLSEEAISNVLGEPKTVRELNLAGTGIEKVTQLETPFLHKLNLSYNNITDMPLSVFERATLLEVLDISHNHLSNLSYFPKIWEVLKNIQTLNISSNPIISISQNDLAGLESLKSLSIHDLPDITLIEKTAFKSVPNLMSLNAYGYPKLGYLDVKGLLLNLPALECLNIESKDAVIGSDQLQTVLHPRLKELGLAGLRLRTLSSGTISGLKREEVAIRIRNTSITSLPPALFFPVPRSSRIMLDVSGSQLTTVSAQLLQALDDRRGDLKIVGLESNPIVCDCGARALRRWLPSHMDNVQCAAPPHLKGKFLIEIGDDELTCDVKKQTTIASTISTTTKVSRKTTEPDIIWSVAPAKKNKPINNNVKGIVTGQSSVNNDDTLIIGIVGGVVAFIAILVIIICIIRLRMSNSQYRGGPIANGTSVIGPQIVGPGSSCACSVKGAPPLYAIPSNYTAAGYSATLPHKIQLSGSPIRTTYSTMGRVPYQTAGQPYFIAYPSEEKIYR